MGNTNQCWNVVLILIRCKEIQQPYNTMFSIQAPMSVKVTIDQDECTACGLCYNDECPGIFEEGGDGNSNLKKEFQNGGVDKGEIPDDKKACAQSAADSCPVDAITVE
jgi:ferredoxin